ncbi:MBL fold metallo-hydrolase [Brevundimonas sp.]|uniref:MBL fold metallo-hydrolase n=1 Tax=Brevundimonas sp. TaxID=1871086 RepID=UPI002D72C78B|nr:MBL fold metallo-hydrolase [Brevundimonas sp.]HYC73768.1 MBL fold metallo-hydrolase [Brevundimonas sp.]
MRPLLLALACLLTVHGAALADPARAQEPVITVTLLGTGAPPPLADRFGPATLVQAGGQVLLFDAGRGATIRLLQLEVPGSALTATFLTHLHSDHVVGLPDLWLTGWLRGAHGGRSEPFRLVGPPGTVAMAASLEQAFAADIGYRLTQGLPPAGGRIAAQEFDHEGVVHDLDGLRVTAFRVDHGRAVDQAFGYRIDYSGRSVVISGDARPSEAVVRFAEGADLLIHEVAFASDEAEAAVPGVALILATHTRPREAGRIFAAARPGMAVYSHIVRPAIGGFEWAPMSDLIDQTRETYDGPLTLGADLTAFDISADGVVTVRTPPP